MNCLRYCLVALIWLGFGAAQSQDEQILRVGSKRFTESYILAAVIAQTANQATKSSGTKTEVFQGLGNTAIVFEALKSSKIDVYVEYTGTIATEILKSSPAIGLPLMQEQLAKLGFGASASLGFNNGYALAMRAADADRLSILSLSDLAKHPNLKLGLSNEFMGRQDGWQGLTAKYQLPQKPTGLDHGLAYAAIENKQIDVMDIYTTDAKINHLELRLLQDDQNYFPRYDAVLLYRLDVPQKHPAAWAALKKLEGRISEAQMIGMNANAELQSQSFDAIAKQFLAPIHHSRNTADSKPAKPAGSFASQFWTRLWAEDLWRLLGQHVRLVLASVGAASVLGVLLGIFIYPHPRFRAAVLGIASVLQTVPSLAMLVVFIALLGTIGVWPAIGALTLYAILPVLSNTCTGLAEVSSGLRLAAKALGMTSSQSLRWVELPTAALTLLAGIRTATALAIGTATIAAFVGAGGLGERIVTGLALNDSALMLAGAIPAALLAVVSEWLFEAVTRRLKPPAST